MDPLAQRAAGMTASFGHEECNSKHALSTYVVSLLICTKDGLDLSGANAASTAEPQQFLPGMSVPKSYTRDCPNTQPAAGVH